MSFDDWRPVASSPEDNVSSAKWGTDERVESGESRAGAAAGGSEIESLAYIAKLERRLQRLRGLETTDGAPEQLTFKQLASDLQTTNRRFAGLNSRGAGAESAHRGASVSLEASEEVGLVAERSSGPLSASASDEESSALFAALSSDGGTARLSSAAEADKLRSAAADSADDVDFEAQIAAAVAAATGLLTEAPASAALVASAAAAAGTRGSTPHSSGESAHLSPSLALSCRAAVTPPAASTAAAAEEAGDAAEACDAVKADLGPAVAAGPHAVPIAQAMRAAAAAAATVLAVPVAPLAGFGSSSFATADTIKADSLAFAAPAGGRERRTAAGVPATTSAGATVGSPRTASATAAVAVAVDMPLFAPARGGFADDDDDDDDDAEGSRGAAADGLCGASRLLSRPQRRAVSNAVARVAPYGRAAAVLLARVLSLLLALLPLFVGGVAAALNAAVGECERPPSQPRAAAATAAVAARRAAAGAAASAEDWVAAALSAAAIALLALYRGFRWLRSSACECFAAARSGGVPSLQSACARHGRAAAAAFVTAGAAAQAAVPRWRATALDAWQTSAARVGLFRQRAAVRFGTPAGTAAATTAVPAAPAATLPGAGAAAPAIAEAGPDADAQAASAAASWALADEDGGVAAALLGAAERFEALLLPASIRSRRRQPPSGRWGATAAEEAAAGTGSASDSPAGDTSTAWAIRGIHHRRLEDDEEG